MSASCCLTVHWWLLEEFLINQVLDGVTLVFQSGDEGTESVDGGNLLMDEVVKVVLQLKKYGKQSSLSPPALFANLSIDFIVTKFSRTRARRWRVTIFRTKIASNWLTWWSLSSWAFLYMLFMTLESSVSLFNAALRAAADEGHSVGAVRGIFREIEKKILEANLGIPNFFFKKITHINTLEGHSAETLVEEFGELSGVFLLLIGCVLEVGWETEEGLIAPGEESGLKYDNRTSLVSCLYVRMRPLPSPRMID